MKRVIVLAISVILALVVAMPMTLAQVGQGAKASGTAEELAAAWWQWALSKPVEDNPGIGGDPDYSEAQCDGTPVTPTQGKQWFLAGTYNGDSVVRTCTMPVGTHLFFPVVNSVAFPTETGETEENVRQAVIDFINGVLSDPEFSYSVTVDGKEVNSNRIVRALSPVFSITLPEDNIFEIQAGEYGSASADGLWVTLPPLPPGEHEIHFEMTTGPDGFSQNNTYILTVVNGKPAP